MLEDERLDDGPMEAQHVRWIPSSLLDLPPLEPVFALRTPRRIYLQAMPSSREALRALLQTQPFEISVEVDGDTAPLRHVPLQDVHEVRLAPDLALPWGHFYWIADGLQDDLAAAGDNPGAGLAQGRHRLAVVEETLRSWRGRSPCELQVLCEAWESKKAIDDLGLEGEHLPSASDYALQLTNHLVTRTGSPAFAEWMADLARTAGSNRAWSFPQLSRAERQLLESYLQHRTLGNVALASPTGMIAGWHLLLSMALLGVWYAGLLVHAEYEHDLDEALVASLWMLDQGFWCDESLVHDTLRHLHAKGHTEPALAQVLSASLAGAPTRT